MITATPHNYFTKADSNKDCSLGNVLFTIAGVIGVAVKNGYEYGFPPWPNQCYFVNPLPLLKNKITAQFQNPINYKSYDVGFRGFGIPDNVWINGYFGSEKYFKHCEDLIRKQFQMVDLVRSYPFDDCVLIHCRNYAPNISEMNHLSREYYLEAMKYFSGKKPIVITDNIELSQAHLRLDASYVSNSPIVDLYLMSRAKNIIMANSTFSWWGAWLSKAKTVAPKDWYAGDFSDCPKDDLYCEGWIII